jgi:hypothetical protein
MGAVRVALLVVPECPHEAAARDVLTTAMRDIGLGSIGYTLTVVDSQKDVRDVPDPAVTLRAVN